MYKTHTLECGCTVYETNGCFEGKDFCAKCQKEKDDNKGSWEKYFPRPIEKDKPNED